ncbi:MAG: hypothetical protein ACREJQ_02135, partial [bacterium]
GGIMEAVQEEGLKMENDSDKMEQIVRRVEKMERANRRLTLISVALGAMLVLILAVGATKQAAVPDVLRAKRLEIVDNKGRSRIEMDAALNYGPALRLVDERDVMRAEFAVSGDGTQLFLYDGGGKVRASLSAFANGPALMLSDRGKIVRAGLRAFSDRTVLRLADKNGNIIWQAPEKR